ncbi:hypothetical protein GMSM_00830 [Geomonas sp. Red276]
MPKHKRNLKHSDPVFFDKERRAPRMVNITEGKRATEAPQQSEERYRTLFNTMTEGFCVLGLIFDADNHLVDCRLEETNPAFEAHTGWHDAKGKLVRDLAPDLEPYWYEIYEHVAVSGEPAHFEDWAKPLNRWFQVSAYSIGNPGAPKVAVVFKDITESKLAEQALQMSEATLKLAIETAELGIFEWDIGSGKHRWSDIAKEHHGLLPETEVDHARFLAGVHPDDRDKIDLAIREALVPEGGFFNVEYRTIGEIDRKVRWLTARGRVHFDEKGAPLRMVGACLDITHIIETEKALKDEIAERLRTVEELRKQEQLMIRQGRLAAMGEMIGNIAHQWRQPLNSLGLLIQQLPLCLARGALTNEVLDETTAKAMALIRHMSKTIDGFRNFFSPDKEKELFRGSELLAKAVTIVEAAFMELNLVIEVKADQEVEIYGYPNEFSQVILNILVNAKDAILERRIERPWVSVNLFRESGKTVLTISDNAGGITPDILDKIFDPYFTTKGPDKGTGIGLFMSKTIIEKNMNGKLTVSNTEDGAQFRIEV